MFGAIDAGLIMDLAERKRKEEEEMKKTPEGRAKLAHKEAVKASFDNIPEGAQAYYMTKISGHQNPENRHSNPIRPGTTCSGFVRVFTDECVKFMEENGEESKEFDGIPWECQMKAKPKIGSVFYVGGLNSWGRTSIVRGYYKHEDSEGYAEHPDKLVLPSEFPIESAANLPPLEVDDIVICTMNSLYLCREVPGVTYQKDDEEEVIPKSKTA